MFYVTKVPVSKISGCDIRCHGTFWPDPELEPGQHKMLDIRYIPEQNQVMISHVVFTKQPEWP